MVGGADPLVAWVVSALSTPKACWINEVLIALLPPPQPPLWDDSNAALPSTLPLLLPLPWIMAAQLPARRSCEQDSAADTVDTGQQQRCCRRGQQLHCRYCCFKQQHRRFCCRLTAPQPLIPPKTAAPRPRPRPLWTECGN